MKILSISGILPIPGLIRSNDFVFHTYQHYKELFRNDDVIIVRPTQYKTNIKQILTRSTELNRLNGQREFSFYGMKVLIFPFLSTRRVRNLHAFLSYSAFFFNKSKLDRIINENAIDVVHAQYIFPDGLLAMIIKKRYQIPYVITTHNELFYFRHVFSKLIATRIVKTASYVLPLNFSNFTYYKSIGLSNLELVPLGFNKKFLRPQKKTSDETVRILTVAELIKLKNIDKVLFALKQLDDKHPFKYTIIGRGPEKENLENLATKLQLGHKVEFIDHIDHEEIANKMYGFDIFIMPSYIETFGRVYFEAMALGMPIICARNSGIFGYFKENEEGISVNHKDIGEISDKLEMLIKYPEKRLKIGNNGQKLVAGYTWERIAEILHEKYTSLLNTKPEINQA